MYSMSISMLIMLEKLGGRVPLSLLSNKRSDCSDVSRAELCGIVPLISWPFRWRNARDVIVFQLAGSVPDIVVL